MASEWTCKAVMACGALNSTTSISSAPDGYSGIVKGTVTVHGTTSSISRTRPRHQAVDDKHQHRIGVEWGYHQASITFCEISECVDQFLALEHTDFT